MISILIEESSAEPVIWLQFYELRHVADDCVHCAAAGTSGTVRVNIHGLHSTNKDFLVSRNDEDGAALAVLRKRINWPQKRISIY